MSRRSTRAPLSWTILAIVQSLLLASALAFPALAIANNGNGNGNAEAQLADSGLQLYVVPEEDSLTAGDATGVDAVTCAIGLDKAAIVGANEKLGGNDDHTQPRASRGISLVCPHYAHQPEPTYSSLRIEYMAMSSKVPQR